MASQGSFSEDRHEEASVIRGHHVYKSVWTPEVGEELSLVTEDGNEHDKYAVASVHVASRHAHPVMTRRLYEARRLLRTQRLIPRRINGACVYSREVFIRGNTVH